MPRPRLSSVANAMRLLRAFSDERSALGVSELARHMGLAKSTIHRLAATLVGQRMLEQDGDGKYRLGLLLFELGSLVRRKMDVSAEARPMLKSLMEKTGETVHLAVLDGDSALYVNRVESRSAIRMGFGLGVRVPLHCTAVGKALLAFQPPDFIDETLGRGLPRRTPATITQPQRLRQELAAIRTRGYAVEDEEIELGLRAVGAVVRDDSGCAAASIGISGPAQRMSRKVILSYVPELLSAVDALSQRLGYAAPAIRRRA